eukprot:1600591-Pyramimonas_sp.AAC.1
MIDALHCPHLGILQCFIAEAIWLCIEANVRGIDGPMDVVIEQSCKLVHNDMIDWYQNKHIPNCDRLAVLTAKMLGDHVKKEFKGKAAETA